MPRRTAFTLVELLVVITIIIVLLALLVPALDRAVYVAELVVCASQTRNIAMGVTGYAMDHKRSYPDRGNVTSPPPYQLGAQPVDLVFAEGEARYFDDRTKLQNYIAMGISGHLNCPLTGSIDVAGADPDSWIMSPYALYFGWSFVDPDGWSFANSTNSGRRLQGMTRLGSRMQWRGTEGTTYSFDVLACDDDLFTTGTGYSTHPNDKGAWENQVVQNGGATVLGKGYKVTLSRWFGPSTGRGLLDLNFALTDGSVTRIDSVSISRFSRESAASGKVVPVPYITMTSDDTTFYRHLPAQY
jgi:hypothetical protein